ncbi:DUF3096 domain-containing protein [Candidatus Woesearchaeota archaeon]|nr:DUF3096 domain-containing protein [Candidatus Woesearchaeota archaeon]
MISLNLLISIITIIMGICVIVLPRFLRYIVGFYLIITGLLSLLLYFL